MATMDYETENGRYEGKNDFDFTSLFCLHIF